MGNKDTTIKPCRCLIQFIYFFYYSRFIFQNLGEFALLLKYACRVYQYSLYNDHLKVRKMQIVWEANVVDKTENVQ